METATYIPPFKRRRLLVDETLSEQQRTFDQLKKGIQLAVNKLSMKNVEEVIKELFELNLIRGRGILVDAILNAQRVSPQYTDLYVCCIAIINTKLPAIGELMLHRATARFKEAYSQEKLEAAKAYIACLAHLMNQNITDDIIAADLITLLLGDNYTDDTIHLAITYLTECGSKLEELDSEIANASFERLRALRQNDNIDQKILYMIDGLFILRKLNFKDHVPIRDELRFGIEDERTFVHQLGLEEELKTEIHLNDFQVDENFEEAEKEYEAIKVSILGDPTDDKAESTIPKREKEQGKSNGIEIHNKEELALREFKKKIFLIITSSTDHIEIVHKIIKSNIHKEREVELCDMILESCQEHKSYIKLYGLLGERFCHLGKIYQNAFITIFEKIYDKCLEDSYDLQALRCISHFYSHLLGTDAISWNLFAACKLTPTDTSITSRTLLKMIFQNLQEFIGFNKLYEKLNDPYLIEYYSGLFPIDHPKHTQFAIDFWIGIGMPKVSEELQNFLKQNAPKELIDSSDESESDESESNH